MDRNAPSKIDLRSADEKVIFIICDCSLDKKYSFWPLSHEEAKDLINRLRHIEKMTWRQLSGLDRKNGLSVEDKDSPNFALIESQDTSDQKLAGEQYYFHIRVEETGKFRVFGYQVGRCFSITHIDPKGKINH